MGCLAKWIVRAEMKKKDGAYDGDGYVYGNTKKLWKVEKEAYHIEYKTCISW